MLKNDYMTIAEASGKWGISQRQVQHLCTLGGGDFAIYWFVIKKITWADLIAVFKKKKENEE